MQNNCKSLNSVSVKGKLYNSGFVYKADTLLQDDEEEKLDFTLAYSNTPGGEAK